MKKNAIVPKKIKGTILAFLLWSVFLSPLHAKENNADIAVIVSSQIRPYVTALDGLRSSFRHPLTIYYLNSNPELIHHHLSRKYYDLVIAIGPEASVLVWSTLNPDDKKIALMVLDPQKLLANPEPCGVDLRISKVSDIPDKTAARRKKKNWNPLQSRGKQGMDRTGAKRRR
ncbi:MAG: hypothetical protein U9N19_00230 [Thermodesulfobacteriota bacterium]|nr:hypothetical protein [Thermodesulfobacteriota bacterium]